VSHVTIKTPAFRALRGSSEERGGRNGRIEEAWRGANRAYRAWASEPTRDRYRAFLDADRRWRSLLGR